VLGVRTLEVFGVIVDNISHRFVATTTIVAATPSTLPSRGKDGNHFADSADYSLQLGAEVLIILLLLIGPWFAHHCPGPSSGWLLIHFSTVKDN